jgi:hypothetical protein
VVDNFISLVFEIGAQGWPLPKLNFNFRFPTSIQPDSSFHVREICHMNKEDELMGRLVLVDPNYIIKTDLMNKIGTIYTFYPKPNVFLINFLEENCCAGYPPDALLILRAPENIRADVARDFVSISDDDYEAITKILSCVESEAPEMLAQAMKISQQFPTVTPYAMHSIQSELNLQRNYYFGR